MSRLNRNQLMVCWIVALLISFFIVRPAFYLRPMHEYKSEDGWVWRIKGYHGAWEFLRPPGERYDEKGAYIVSKRDSDGTVGRKYYYVRTYYEPRLDSEKHPYERFGIATVLIGLLLFLSLGRLGHKG